MSIEINLTALQTFSTDLQETLKAHLGNQLDIDSMYIEAGGSGLPSAATTSNLHNTILHMTAVHNMKLQLGGQAIQLAAQSVAEAYITADGEAESEIAAVRDAFYPPMGTPSLAQALAESAEQGDDSVIEIDPTLSASLPDATDDLTIDAMCDGEPPEPGSVEEMWQNVEDNADIAALGRGDGYDAPEDTPEELYGIVPGTEAPETDYDGLDYDGVMLAAGSGGRPDQVT